MYNKARTAARNGRLDEKRVNRALGILQQKTPERKYITTTKGCSCDDRQWHPDVPCKHMIAKMIEVRIVQDGKPANQPVARSKVIYVELEYKSYTPADIVSNWWDASNCKMSEGHGLAAIEPEVLSEMLQGYKVLKTEYIKKNSWGTISYKMWWERSA